MAGNYFLSYDLNGQRPTHAEMDAHLKKLGKNVHRVLETVWYIRHGGTMEQVFDYAAQILSDNDSLLVIDANNSRMRKLLVPNETLVRCWTA